MPDGGASDLSVLAGAEILDLQRHAFLAAGAPAFAHRRDALKQLRAAIIAHRKAFETAAITDFGHRPPLETRITDLGPTVQAIAYMQANLARWMRPRPRAVDVMMQPGRAEVRYQPLGVVGIMSAWNYPVTLALLPLATALAAGNRAMVKTSELAPATAELLRNVLGQLFDRDEVAVITGGTDVAAGFAALPFDHLFFTGSTGVGRKVMQAAAANLTPVTLELGGKSPVILAADADVAMAAGDVAFAKSANAGQTCIAPDYLMLPETQIVPFAEAFAAAIRRRYPGGLADPGLTTIVSDRHHARLGALLADARAKGAEVRPVLETGNNTAHPRALSPTLVLGATDDMQIMREEIFGPLLPVIAVETTDAAVDRVNAGDKPLALYVYGRDRRVIDGVLDRTTSGNATVNGAMLHYAVKSLPFGGVGSSGIGTYHGIEGFRQLSHAKGVFRPGRRHASRLLAGGNDRIARLIARLMLR